MNARTLIRLNRCFKPVKHPFNMSNSGEKKYSEWEFERGGTSLSSYGTTELDGNVDRLLCGKRLLDIGAGAAGKTVYYLTRGAAYAVAVDLLEDLAAEAHDCAREHGVADRFEYLVCDAACLPFDACEFDAVIMNDAMEHMREPERVLAEIERVLKPHGRLYINFPPYLHPYGEHLSDAIAIPWVHLFFDEPTMIAAYKELVDSLPDARMRIELRISRDENGNEYFSYINKMTIARFNELCRTISLKRVHYAEIPLRRYLSPLARLPILKELLTKCVVAVLEKPA